ncbi:DUF2207 domain-containing protein [Luteimonas sp. S4-F44]|uniref:DUF2207 domain-containing protein n=1 Tax=Luteimonas sp. S4-F44 TaxID=2925842 RepID=UPI001F539A05|nr:DUF2207 domain-containing protein [Luteimonas sp. S4-F44]UNK43422.1 DUF2207 domain-containing protein [Luteimonas sp. S4-F44]
MLAWLLAVPTAWAQERILSDDIEVRVLADGRLDVTERIAIRAEGRIFRHGVVRDIPVRYRDPAGTRVMVDLDVYEVLRDGRPAPWTVERAGNRMRVRVGDARRLPTPSTPVYTLRYRTTRQLGFFDDHDTVYLPALAPARDVEIARGSIAIALPDAVPVETLHADGATGTAGAPGRDFHVALSAAGTARWTLARPLPPEAGWTVSLAFPKGLIAPPSRQQRLAWWLHDHRGPLVALAGLATLLVLYTLQRRRHHRGHATDDTTLRDVPPPGFSPGGLRYLQRMRYDARCLSSDLLAAAVDDHVHLVRERTSEGMHWRVLRTRTGAHRLPTLEQRALLTALLPGTQDAIVLEPAQAEAVGATWRAHERALRRRFQPALFGARGGRLLAALAVALVSAAAALWLSADAGLWAPTLAIVAAMGLVLVAFAMRARSPTAEGDRLLAHVQGLRRYLAGDPRMSGAEAAPPLLDVHHYEHLLPYAVALDVEAAWTRRFVAAAGPAAASASVADLPWYRGVVVTDLERFCRSVGQGLARRIAAARTPAARRTRRRRRQAEGDASR